MNSRLETIESSTDGFTAVTVDPTILDYLLELRDAGGEDFLAEVIALFIEDARLRLRAVRAAAGGGDGEGLRRAAHSLKGSSANLGATQLAQLSAELEQRGGAGHLTDIGPHVRRLERELGHVVRVLELVLGQSA